MSEIQVGSIAAATPRLDPAPLEEKGPGGRFGDLLQGVLAEANRAQNTAETTAAALTRGEADMVDTVLAVNEADLSLRLVMQLRNRLMKAYQEVIRTI